MCVLLTHHPHLQQTNQPQSFILLSQDGLRNLLDTVPGTYSQVIAVGTENETSLSSAVKVYIR